MLAIFRKEPKSKFLPKQIKMRTIIVEDDLEQQNWLEAVLKEEFPEIKIVDKVGSVTHAIDALNRKKIDFAIMDVMIKGGTTFDVLERLSEIEFHIIFTTSFENFAIRAFKQAAVDYLLKPIDRNEFIQAVEKVAIREEERKVKEQYEVLIANYQHPVEERKIAISDSSEILFVYPKNIIRCYSENTYTTFYFTDREPLTVSKTLRHCEQILEGFGFIRVHNRSLVNINHIEKFNRAGNGSILMSDGKEVEISRRRKESLMQAFKEL